MKPGGEQWQVDDELLTETGRGGLFTNGYLEGEPLISYLEGEETPLFVFGSGKRGITKESDGQTDRIVPGSGYRAITAITDRRIQFVVGGGREDGDWAADVRLADVDRVAVEEGLIREKLSISTDGTIYHVYLKDVDTERVVTFLEDVSWAWIQVEELLDQARKKLVDASQYEKSREYDAAKAAITDAREALDEAIGVTEDLAAEASSGIQDRIDQVEGRYRETKRRVHASRATHLVDQAERHWRDDEFERAYEQFSTARQEYCTILDIYGLDPDKADAMRERIVHVDGNLEHLSQAPLRRAKDACNRALDASDPEDALEHWEEALKFYRRVIELDWGREEKRFEGDVDLVRDRVAKVVDEILSTRRTLTERCIDRADERLEAAEYSQAREIYAEAMDHLEAAIELAYESDPEAVDELEERLETLEGGIRNATDSVSEATEMSEALDRKSNSGTAQAADADDSEASSETDYDDFDNWVTLANEADSQTDDSQQQGGDPDEMADDSGGPPQILEDTVDWQSDDGSGPIERENRALDDALVDDPDPDDAVVDAVSVLDSDELATLVGTVWEALGWSTTVEGDSVLASRTAPMEEVTVIGIAADGTVTDATVTSLAERRQREDATRAVLVSNVRITPDGARQATTSDIELIDVESLAGIIERESLTDHLPDATP